MQLMDAWLQMPPSDRRRYEEQAAAMRGLSLAPGIAALPSSVGPPIGMGGTGSNGGGHGGMGQQQQQQQRFAQQSGFSMDQQFQGNGVGGGGQLNMPPMGVPPQWAREREQLQQQERYNLQKQQEWQQNQTPRPNGSIQGMTNLDLNMHNMQREMACMRFGLALPNGGHAANGVQPPDGRCMMQGEYDAARNGLDSSSGERGQRISIWIIYIPIRISMCF